MGQRGPLRTPTKVLAMRGSWLADTRNDEPEPASGSPQCPKGLVAPARRHWKRVVRDLAGMRILARCDQQAIGRYCQMTVRWWELEAFLTQEGSTYTDEHGRLCEYPQAGQAVRLADQLLKLEKHFGLTPAARAGMAIKRENPIENRGKDRFFKQA